MVKMYVLSYQPCDTTSLFVRRGKIAPLKLVEKNPQYLPILRQIGEERQCSELFVNDMETFTCAFYGGTKYNSINKLHFDTFLRKHQSSITGNVLNVSDGADMSLLPPCRSALEMHIRRVNYIKYLYGYTLMKITQISQLFKTVAGRLMMIRLSMNGQGQLNYSRTVS